MVFIKNIKNGDQVDDMRGGAAITVTPLIPFKMAQVWQLEETVIINFERYINLSHWQLAHLATRVTIHIDYKLA